MLNWKPEDAEMYEDVQTRYHWTHDALGKSTEERLRRLWRSSRDSARTPMQWSQAENAGFTTGKPWFYVNPNYQTINVEQQQSDPDSILNFYRKAIALRKKLSSVRDGNYIEYRKRSRKHYIYSRQDARQKILVVCSFSDKPTRLHIPRDFYLDGAVLALCNYDSPDRKVLKPYEARVYLWK